MPTYQQLVRLLTGMSLGFSLGVVLCVLGTNWAGSIGLIALIVGLVMGGGSNLLLTSDFDGIVVRSAISDASCHDTLINCGSGWEWDVTEVRKRENLLRDIAGWRND